MTTYVLGNIVRVTLTFTNLSGALTDPTTVILKVRDPQFNSTTYSGGSVIHDSTGVYHIDLTPTIEGNYRYRGEGSGTVTAAVEGTFDIHTIYV